MSNLVPRLSKALSKSGFNDTLTYTPKTTDCDTSQKEKHKRQVMIYYTIFIKCENKRGKIFLKLVKRHFPNENSTQDFQ